MNKMSCPFCGNKDDECLFELVDDFDNGFIAHVHCFRCKADGPTKVSDEGIRHAIERAIEAWNKRQ